MVDSFCYLGDVSGQSGGCFDAITLRVLSAWKNFRDLLPILTNRGFSSSVRGLVYNSCVRSVLLYGSETWAVKVENINRLTRNDNSMIRWTSSAKLSDRKSMSELRHFLGLLGVAEVVRWGRLRWYGHLMRMNPDNWPREILDYQIEGSYSHGRPSKRWLDCINDDLKHLNVDAPLAQNSVLWRRPIWPRGHEHGGV